MSKDHVQAYIDAVESGNIVVGKKVGQAITRHQKDLEKQGTEDFPYVYKPEVAELPIEFISNLPDPKTRKPNQLALFQLFILGLLFGWVHKDTGKRRFRKAYISVSRKNGKKLA